MSEPDVNDALAELFNGEPVKAQYIFVLRIQIDGQEITNVFSSLGLAHQFAASTPVDKCEDGTYYRDITAYCLDPKPLVAK